jgi:hypothetical protein
MSEKKRLKYVNEMFQKSVFSSKQNFNSLRALDASSFEKILKDPLFIFVNSLNVSYKSKIRPQLIASNLKLDSLYMVYIDAQRQMLPERQFFADANSTLRVAYGAVERAPQADGILYDFRTTLDGVVAKDNPSIYDYNVPQRLKDLYRTKDYGRWAENGTVPVCFLASNHTTGGNSGSPVIDADGNLIGVNFDRSWESTMSDVMFDPVHCRNIVLDIRYALFVIDKFAGAGYLIDEMTLVK